MGFPHTNHGSNYFTSASSTPAQQFTWNLDVPATTNFDVYVYVPAAGNLGTGSYTVTVNGTASSPILVNQTTNAGKWVQLVNPTPAAGTTSAFALTQGASASIALSSTGSTVAADAVKIVQDTAGTTVTPTAAESYSYSYDPDGNRIGAADHTPGAQFDNYVSTFYPNSQLSELDENLGTTTVHKLKYAYYPDNLTSSQTLDQQRTDTYGYDSDGRLATVENQQTSTDPGLITRYTYTNTGLPKTETKGNQNTVTATYNSDGTLATSTEATSTGTVVDSHVLGYDASNNVTSDKYSVQSATSATTMLTRSLTRTYSPNNQVTQVQDTSASPATTLESYTYDSAGNISQQTTATGGQLYFTYDRGRMYAVTNASGGASTYQYDTLGRLHGVANGTLLGAVSGLAQQYSYDAFDNITQQQSTTGSGSTATTNTTDYTYDTLNRTHTETLNPKATAPQQSTFDYFGTGKVLADESITGSGYTGDTYNYSPTGERLGVIATPTGPSLPQDDFYTYNPHSDVEALTNTSGATVQTYGYTAYGNSDSALNSGTDSSFQPQTTASMPFNPYRFNDARIDIASGNLNMGARTYSPETHRFLTGDAYSGAGSDQGIAADPMGSRYAFAGGNPISNIEMDGHDWKSALGIGVAVAGVVGIGVCAFLTDGVCLAAVGAAAGEGATFGVGGAVGGALISGVFEGGAAVGASIGIGGAAGGMAAGAAAVEESAASDLGAADAGAADAGGQSGAVAEGSGSGPGCGGESFTADTKVQMADGSAKAISTLNPGDKVKSTDTATGRTKGSKTSAVQVNHDTDLYDLTVHTAEGDQVIHTTSHHLFFDHTTHTWVEASKLGKGDELTTEDGSTATVVSGTTPAVSSGDMWDLTVPGDHDFYVLAGDTPILVHNINMLVCDKNGNLLPNGGKYGQVKNPAGAGYEVNHMPQQASYRGLLPKLTKYSGPSIRMLEADHTQLWSTDNFTESQAWAEMQRSLVKAGRIDEAFMNELNDVASRFPGRYDDQIGEAIDSLASNAQFQALRGVPTQVFHQPMLPFDDADMALLGAG